LRGGPSYATHLLEQALGPARARPILERMQQQYQSGLSRLRRAAPETLVGLLRDEHPQALALVLAHLDDAQSLALLKALEPERAQDALWRVARLGAVSPDTLALVERTIMAQLDPRPSTTARGEGGPDRVARLLNLAGEDLEKPVLEAIERRDAELAREVRNRMFTFEDLLRVDSRGMQRVLREVDGKELAMALKVASDELKQHIRKAMSERAAGALEEEMEMLGPVRVRDVEGAQGRIIETVRSLGHSGEITIAGQGADDVVV
jgi:flagellar motor switch protein FliG